VNWRKPRATHRFWYRVTVMAAKLKIVKGDQREVALTGGPQCTTMMT
jgi:hypothetical protein